MPPSVDPFAPDPLVPISLSNAALGKHQAPPPSPMPPVEDFLLRLEAMLSLF